MKFLLICLLFIFSNPIAFAQDKTDCSHAPRWLKAVCLEVNQIWTKGDNELYIPAYAWHNRYTYSQRRLDTYNENPWGGGMGKSFYDTDGDWHALYAFAFLDSHKNVEPVAGYAFVKMLSFTQHARAGAGFALLVTARPDIFHNIPFPGILPWVSLNYRKASIGATYIPGAQGAGNVLFLLFKYAL